jgi:hypothetical protein
MNKVDSYQPAGIVQDNHMDSEPRESHLESILKNE